MKAITEDTIRDILVEMFKRVGKTFTSFDQVSETNWFHKNTWSQEEQDSFHEWLVQYLRNDLKMNKESAENSASSFIFVYGWKLDE